MNLFNRRQGVVYLFLTSLMVLQVNPAWATLGNAFKQVSRTQFQIWLFDQTAGNFEIYSIQNIQLFNSARDSTKPSCVDEQGNLKLFPARASDLVLNPKDDWARFVIERWDQGKCNYWFNSGSFLLTLRSKVDGSFLQIHVTIDQFFHAKRFRNLIDVPVSEALKSGRSKLKITVDSVEPVINLL